MVSPKSETELHQLPPPAPVRSASVFADLVDTRGRRRPITLVDVAGLVVGYAAAAQIFRRTVLAPREVGAVGLTIVAALMFAWLGLVVAGPVVLGLRRMQHGKQGRYSPGETIWMVLGSIWFAVGLTRYLRFVEPVLMTNAASMLAALAAGIAPLFLVLYWRAERQRGRTGIAYSWCHHAGIACAAAWPAAWCLAAFLLGI